MTRQTRWPPRIRTQNGAHAYGPDNICIACKVHRQDQTAERCADERPLHGKGEPPPPPPALPHAGLTMEQRKVVAFEEIAVGIGRLAAVAERLCIEAVDPDDKHTIAGAIDRLADAIRGQRFATVVNATFEQKE